MTVITTFKRAFLVTLAGFVLLAAGFAAGTQAWRWGAPAPVWPLLRQAAGLLAQNGYATPPPAPALEYGMIRGMLQAYNDPYTIFVEPPQAELQSNELEGAYGGIGVRLGKNPGGEWLLYPFPGSSAARAGLLEGDRLTGVDALAVSAETPSETILAALRGPVDSTVIVRLLRPPQDTPIEVSLRREQISLPSVTWHVSSLDTRLGVIEINRIAASTPDEVRAAMDALLARQAQAFALDLRDDYGGLLTAGIDVARLFLASGEVMEQRYRDRPVEIYRVESPGAYLTQPLAVLVNANTASAAEIIAGALKAPGRAWVIGQPTYGKDSIQLIFELNDKSSLHVTSARWAIPGLEPPIGPGGLLPDIELPADTPPDSLAWEQAAVELLLLQRRQPGTP